MTKWTAACHAPLIFTISQSLLKFMATELVILYSLLILCLQPSFCLLSFPAWVFFSESVLHIRWPKCWSFGFNISPSNEYSGMISFRVDWLDLLGVQGTLKRLLQHHNSKHQFFSAQTYGPTLTYIHDHWKNHSFD